MFKRNTELPHLGISRD